MLQHWNKLISQLTGLAAGRQWGERALPGLQKHRNGWQEDLVILSPNPTQQKDKVQGENLGLQSCWGAAKLQLQASI